MNENKTIRAVSSASSAAIEVVGDQRNAVGESWVRRLMGRLFPSEECPDPASPKHNGVIKTVTRVRMTWRGLIRLLLTRRLVVETKTTTRTQVECGPTTHAVWVEWRG